MHLTASCALLQGSRTNAADPVHRHLTQDRLAPESPAIGRQRFAGDIDADVFRRDIARARTFGFLRDVERLWAAGYALGSSLENSLVIGDDDPPSSVLGHAYAIGASAVRIGCDFFFERDEDDGEHVDEQREYEDDDDDLDAPARSGVGRRAHGTRE